MDTVLVDAEKLVDAALTPTVAPKNDSLLLYAFKWLIAMVIAAVVLLGAFAAADKFGMFDSTTTPTAATSSGVVLTGDAAKVSFTFTDQWHRILTPAGTMYSRCDPYSDGQRWVMAPTGTINFTADRSCKHSS